MELAALLCNLAVIQLAQGNIEEGVRNHSKGQAMEARILGTVAAE